MKKSNVMKKLTRILGGILLVAAGIIWGLNIMGIADIDIFFDGWWTLFIIIPCFAGLFSKGDKLGNLFCLLIGITLLLAAQNIIEYSLVWKLLLPALIVAIGIRWIFNGLFKKSRKNETNFDAVKGGKNHVVIFSGSDVNYAGQVFEGADFTAIFGGIDVHLENAVIDHDVTINATAIFGGIDIFLPDNVKVEVSSASVFGGVENGRRNKAPDSSATVYINGSGIFGAIDIE